LGRESGVLASGSAGWHYTIPCRAGWKGDLQADWGVEVSMTDPPPVNQANGRFIRAELSRREKGQVL
jgi:hypothetical protein